MDDDIAFEYTINFQLDEFRQFKDIRGVYFIYDDSDSLVYIGKASDLEGRFIHHIGKNSLFEGIQKHFKTIKIKVINSHVRRDEYEKYLINKYKPPYNIQYRDDIDIVPSHLRKISKLQADKEYFRKRFTHKNKENDEFRLKNKQLQQEISRLYENGFSLDNNVFAIIDKEYKDEYINLYFDNKEGSDFFLDFLKELVKGYNQIKSDHESLKESIRNLIE